MDRSTGVWCTLAFAAGLLAGEGLPEAAIPVPGREDGQIRQGPFLLFGDQKGGLHPMKGSEVIIRGIGIFCGNGGYWPYDRMANGKVTFGKGRLSFRGDVPGKNITYEQTASIAGQRIKLTMRRTGAWGRNRGWDGLTLWLPFEYYKEAPNRIDGKEGTFPAKYAGGSHYVATNVRKLECHLGDPAFNLVLECASGFSVSDERRWGGQRYRISAGIARYRREGSIDIFLTLPQLPADAGAAVRYSRIGYPVDGAKVVVLEWPKHASRPDDHLRLEGQDGAVIKEGRFGKTEQCDYMQSKFASFDFTELKQPGEYRVVWSHGAVEFPIRQSVFEDRLWAPTLDFFMPFQMCHADVDLGDLPDHRRCHLDDATRVPANFPGVDAFRSYECKGTPYKAGQAVPCANGGWHDAGDCDVNINAQSFTVWILSLAYEEFGIDRDVGALDVEAQAYTAGKPDGVPDIVQQIEWGALWLLSMLQPDGRTFVGVVAQPQRYSLGGKKWSEATDNQPGTGDERHLYVDYHADLQLMQATGLSAASRALAKARPELAKKCLEGARKAFEYFRTHKEVYRRTVYFNPHRKGRDGAVAAALAELYLTTRDPAYLRQLEDMGQTIRELSFSWPHISSTTASTYWYAPPVLARLHGVLAEGALKEAVMATCRRAAESQAGQEAPRPWPFHYWHFGKWGNNSACVVRAFDAYWLGKVVPDVFSAADALRSMLWIYGLHPLNDRVFVSGIGWPGPQHIHSGQIMALFGREPGTVPGALVPGLNGIFSYKYKNVLCYRDDGNCGNCEVGVSHSALYIFAVNAMRKAGF